MEEVCRAENGAPAALDSQPIFAGQNEEQEPMTTKTESAAAQWDTWLGSMAEARRPRPWGRTA
jgi:hypothetical protein